MTTAPAVAGQDHEFSMSSHRRGAASLTLVTLRSVGRAARPRWNSGARMAASAIRILGLHAADRARPHTMSECSMWGLVIAR